jgi:hypothetical protein
MVAATGNAALEVAAVFSKDGRNHFHHKKNVGNIHLLLLILL